MKFIVDNDDRTNQLEITILIVEDSFEQASNIQSSIQHYEPMLNGKRDLFKNDLQIVYKIVINGKENCSENEFESELAATDSFRYLQNSSGVDVILCDFDLGNKTGDTFLNQIKNYELANNLRSYKVLHSVGWEYQKYQNMRIADLTLDSKQRIAIQEVFLKSFEENIVATILFGSPDKYSTFYAKHENFQFKLINELQNYGGIRFEKILAICSHPRLSKKFKVFYLNDDYTVNDLTSEESLAPLKDSSYFHSIGRSLIINKLWIGDLDMINNRIKFIRSSNSQFIFDIETYFGSKKKKAKVIEFLYSLISTKTLQSAEEFRTSHPYFHFD